MRRGRDGVPRADRGARWRAARLPARGPRANPRGRGAPRCQGPHGPRGRAHRVQGSPVHPRRADDCGLAHPRGLSSRPTTRPWCGAARRPGSCPSARRTWTSSRWARPPRTPPTARRGTRGTRARVPGGSSGGSAAAVAAGLAPLALGTDTGGSIRQPAALCGVVGLKPTYGASPATALVAFASSLDQIGPFGRTVRDCALLLRVIAGDDPRDATCSVAAAMPVELPVRDDLAGCASACLDVTNIEGVEPGVRAELRGGARDAARPRRRRGARGGARVRSRRRTRSPPTT